jgi:hypothetical protein
MAAVEPSIIAGNTRRLLDPKFKHHDVKFADDIALPPVQGGFQSKHSG